MPVVQDFEVGAIHALSATNKIAILGGSDSTINGKTTLASIASVRALPVTAGTSPDLIEKVAIGLEHGILAGVLPSGAHGYTTLTGMAIGIAAQIPGYSSDFAGFLPQ